MRRQSIPPVGRFERSPFTQALLDRIIAAEENEVLPYAELSKIAGDDVQNGARRLLYSARMIALESHGIATDAVINVGVKRLDDAGAVAVASSVPKRVHRAVRRGERYIETVDPTGLDAAEQGRLSVARLHLGILNVFSRPRTFTALQAAANKAKLPRLEDIAKTTLALFK